MRIATGRLFRAGLVLAVLAATSSNARACAAQSAANDPQVGDAPAAEQQWQFGPVRVIRRASPTDPLVSDWVHVQIEATAPQDVELELGQSGDIPKDATIDRRHQSAPSVSSGERTWTLEYDVDVLAPGRYSLPATEVRYRPAADQEWTVARTPPLVLTFRSSLGSDEGAMEPRPNPGPLPLPPGPFPWFWAVAGLLLLAILAAAGYFVRRRRLRRGTPRVPISAYRKAIEAIDQIEQAGWLERGEMDRFYTELSAAVRRYVEDRFRLHAPEQTTEEFLQELARRPVLTRTQTSALGGFLEQSDLVKFARVRPAMPEGQEALRAARAFLDATRDDSVLVDGTTAAVSP